jgi:hypothetical protein
MVEEGGWDRFVQAVRRAHSAAGRSDSIQTPDGANQLAALGVRRLRGGHHWVYEARWRGQTYFLKLYRLDGRGSAEREWWALRLLAERGGAHAPQPVFFDPTPDVPALVTEFIRGEPLGRRSLTRSMLASLADALREMYRITPADVETAALAVLPALDHAGRAPDWVRTGLENLHRDGITSEPVEEVAALAAAWLGGPDPDALAAPAALAFSRCDGNLDNCLWNGQRMVVVDYEKSGWRDRAFDLADAIELDRAWSLNDGFAGTHEDDWLWFTDRFDLSNAERTRFLAARRALALFWLLRLCRAAAPGARRAKPVSAEQLAARAEAVRRL